jgi:selenide, water dikinase
VLGKLARQQDPNVLVGFDHADDAGVYLLTPEMALVQTVDFFTPIVDDPFTFGQIAATNALSDVYAMGGKPLTSLALVCFPEKGDLGILERILAGGLSKMIEAGCTVVGGHSIRDDETKFGYSVTGVVHPQRVLANQGAQSGDKLLLTKALGTGVISTAIKKGIAKQEWVDAAVRSMTTLNKAAADVITGVGVGTDASQARPEHSRRAKADQSSAVRATPQTPWRIHALTDITGFGLIGHSREMALASEVSLILHSAKITKLDGAIDCIRAGYIPGGLTANREFTECLVEYENGISDDAKTILFDPQTAGGLLISVASESADALRQALKAAGVPAAEIGEVVPRTEPLIRVTN